MTLREALEQKWRKRDGSVDERMVEYCLKSDIYVQVGDIYINCGRKKPAIDSIMWYDDETKGPEADFDNFKRYNMRSSAPGTFEERTDEGRRKAYIVDNYYLNKGETYSPLKQVVFRDDRYDRMDDNERLATEEEVKAVAEALKEARADYEKRLERYWKRYSHKVHASGYWANR